MNLLLHGLGPVVCMLASATSIMLLPLRCCRHPLEPHVVERVEERAQDTVGPLPIRSPGRNPSLSAGLNRGAGEDDRSTSRRLSAAPAERDREKRLARCRQGPSAT